MARIAKCLARAFLVCVNAAVSGTGPGDGGCHCQAR